MTDAAHASTPMRVDHEFGARHFGAVNWLGVWTLYKREVLRFLKVAFQTVFAPIITTLLYLTVFLAAFSGSGRNSIMDGQVIPFASFLPPGLVMMAILNNSFQNASSSLIISKVQGSIVDILMPPLSAAELTAAYILGAATRGLLVGFVTLVTISGFSMFTSIGVAPQSYVTVLYFGVMAAILLGAAGAMAGMWADKFDQLALISNFIITPLTFLSGTFFSVHKPGVPEWVATASHFNPIFYLIDGFRSGFIGVSDASVLTGAVVTFVLVAAAVAATFTLFRRGYKLKA